MLAAHTHEIPLRFKAVACLPRLHSALCERFRAVRNCEVIINRYHPAKAAAGLTGAERMVEAEHRGDGLAVFDVAFGTVQMGGKLAHILNGPGWIQKTERQFAFAEVIGLFASFDKSRPVPG